jgi:hypothetical protein
MTGLKDARDGGRSALPGIVKAREAVTVFCAVQLRLPILTPNQHGQGPRTFPVPSARAWFATLGHDCASAWHKQGRTVVGLALAVSHAKVVILHTGQIGRGVPIADDAGQGFLANTGEHVLACSDGASPGTHTTTTA